MLKQCPHCDYPLAGLPAAHRCPECGLGYDEFSQLWCRSAGWRDLLDFLIVPAVFLLCVVDVSRMLLTGQTVSSEYVAPLLLIAAFSAYLAMSWPRMRSYLHRGTQVAALPSALHIAGFQESGDSSRTLSWEDIDLSRSRRHTSSIWLFLRERNVPIEIRDVFADENEAAEFMATVEFHVARRMSQSATPRRLPTPGSPPPGVRRRARLDLSEPPDLSDPDEPSHQG